MKLVIVIAHDSRRRRRQRRRSPNGIRTHGFEQVDLSPPGREAVTAVAELQPGAAAGRHTHPGEEIGYVIDRTALVEIEGKSPMTLTSGTAFLTGRDSQRDEQGIRRGPHPRDVHRRKGKPVATPAK